MYMYEHREKEREREREREREEEGNTDENIEIARRLAEKMFFGREHAHTRMHAQTHTDRHSWKLSVNRRPKHRAYYDILIFIK